MDWCKYTYVNRWMKLSETIQKYAGQRQITIYEDGGNMVCLHMDHLDDYERKDFPKQRNQYQKNGGRGKKLSQKWLRIKASWIDDNITTIVFAPKGMFMIHGRMNIWKILCAGGHSDFSQLDQSVVHVQSQRDRF